MRVSLQGLILYSAVWKMHKMEQTEFGVCVCVCACAVRACVLSWGTLQQTTKIIHVHQINHE